MLIGSLTVVSLCSDLQKLLAPPLGLIASKLRREQLPPVANLEPVSLNGSGADFVQYRGRAMRVDKVFKLAYHIVVLYRR